MNAVSQIQARPARAGESACGFGILPKRFAWTAKPRRRISLCAPGVDLVLVAQLAGQQGRDAYVVEEALKLA